MTKSEGAVQETGPENKGIMGCYKPLLILFGFGGFPLMVWPHRWGDRVEVAAFVIALVVSLPICGLAGHGLREAVRGFRKSPMPAKSWRLPAFLLILVTSQMVVVAFPRLAHLAEMTTGRAAAFAGTFVVGIVGVLTALKLGKISEFPLPQLIATAMLSGLAAHLTYNL